MATVREYFEKSFPRTLSAEKTSQMKRQLFSGGQIVESTDAAVPVRTHIDPDAFAIFACFESPFVAEWAGSLIKTLRRSICAERCYS